MFNILTTDSRGVSESLVNVRVHINVKIFGHCHSVVSFVDLFQDPVSKGLTNDSCSHIGYPLFWKARDLLVIFRIVVKATWMVLKEVFDFCRRQCVILRYVDMSDVVLMDTYIIMLSIIK